MTLRSRLAALERAARRRQERGYPVKPVMPRLEFDLTDPETRAFLAEVAEQAEVRGLPVRDRSGGGPIHVMQAEIDVARWIMQDFELTQRWIAAIGKARAAAPVQLTGNVKA